MFIPWFFHASHDFAMFIRYFSWFFLLFVKFRMIFLPETEAVTSGSSPAVYASEIYQPKIGI
jgi:hypothetical protein